MRDALTSFAVIADQVAAGIVLYDADASVLYANHAARQMLGLQIGPFWRSDIEPLPPDEQPAARVLAEGHALPKLRLCMPQPAGPTRWLDIDAKPYVPADAGADSDPSARWVILTLTDVSLEVATAARLQRSEDSLHEIVEVVPVGLCITDDNGFFEYVNRAYCQFYGYSAAELIGRHFTMLIQEEFRQKAIRLYQSFLQGADERDMRREWQVVDKQGRQRVILTDGARITGVDGKPRRVTSIVDISTRREIESQLRKTTRGLEKLAITDVLTDLNNRRHADHLLQVEAKRADRSGGGLLVAMLDIDHFKRVNDEYGHAVGDKVLMAVAAAIRASIRDVDHACRYGGEEFLLVLPSTSLDLGVLALERLAENIRKLHLPELGRPLTISGGVSAYISGESVELAVKRADGALYQAKASGRDRILTG